MASDEQRRSLANEMARLFNNINIIEQSSKFTKNCLALDIF